MHVLIYQKKMHVLKIITVELYMENLFGNLASFFIMSKNLLRNANNEEFYAAQIVRS